jgi:hypothetical protein
MLFVPMAVRTNFWAMKFISFVAFEHEKILKEVIASVWRARARPRPRGRAPRPRPDAGVAVAHERLCQPAFSPSPSLRRGCDRFYAACQASGDARPGNVASNAVVLAPPPGPARSASAFRRWFVISSERASSRAARNQAVREHSSGVTAMNGAPPREIANDGRPATGEAVP